MAVLDPDLRPIRVSVERCPIVMGRDSPFTGVARPVGQHYRLLFQDKPVEPLDDGRGDLRRMQGRLARPGQGVVEHGHLAAHRSDRPVGLFRFLPRLYEGGFRFLPRPYEGGSLCRGFGPRSRGDGP